MTKEYRVIFAAIFTFLYLYGAISPAQASNHVGDAQRKVSELRSRAADAFESANQVKYEISSLERELARLKQNEAIARKSTLRIEEQLARTAIEQYKGTGIGSGFELLFTRDPSQYLRDAQILDDLSRKLASRVKTFKTSSQRLRSSQLILADRTFLLRAKQKQLATEVTKAKERLRAAERILFSLKEADRSELQQSENASEAKILKNSKMLASKFSGNSTRGVLALKFAFGQLGDIYVWGGAGPVKWDCSGLTMRAFASVGVSLPHSAAIQYRYGKSIAFSEVRPGDLVFFGNPISHVAIYMGGGRMVQAPRPGKKVEIGTFSRMFGYKPFIGAKRL